MNELLKSATLRQLDVLVAIQQNDTWADAASMLAMTQSAVSQSMARLGALVGSDLFEKLGSRRALTKSGERVLDYARSVVTLSNELWHEVNCGALSHGLRIGMIDAAALYLLRDKVAAYRRDRRDVDVFVAVDVSERLLERLALGELDLVFVVGADDEGQVAVVATEELRLYGTQQDGRAVLYEPGSRTRRLIDGGLVNRGIRADVQAVANNPAVLKELARLGVGWTVLPTGVAEQGDPLSPVGPVIAERDLVAVRRPSDHDQLTSEFLAWVTRSES
jgi:DNA-binding transcriptional LysR family regulator